MHMPRNESQPSRSWSEYKWSEQYGQWYSERLDRLGNVEYAWAGSEQPADNDQSIPRSDHSISSIDQITQGVGNLDVGHGAYNQAQPIRYQAQPALTTGSTAFDLSTSPSYTHDVTRYGQRPRKDKGKGRVEQVEGYGDASYSGSNLGPADSYDTQTPQYSTSNFSTGGRHPAAMNMTNTASYRTQGDYHDAEDPAVLEAMRISKETYYGQKNDATPRNTPVPGTLIPQPTTRANHIQGTDGYEEIMDNRFRVEHSARFQPGEVFKILWSEPLGQVPGDEPISDIRQQRNEAGKLFHVGFRRFIIVTTDESHHSTCVPILTYDRRGCGKKGVKADKHGIIYAAKYKPKQLKGEPDLGFDPVALNIYAEGEKLAKESRVNYSKLVTIEHNVKVYFIGSIYRPHFDTVRDAVNECWDKKMHKSSKRARG